jgi:hypothetical protein
MSSALGRMVMSSAPLRISRTWKLTQYSGDAGAGSGAGTAGSTPISPPDCVVACTLALPAYQLHCTEQLTEVWQPNDSGSLDAGCVTTRPAYKLVNGRRGGARTRWIGSSQRRLRSGLQHAAQRAGNDKVTQGHERYDAALLSTARCCHGIAQLFSAWRVLRMRSCFAFARRCGTWQLF